MNGRGFEEPQLPRTALHQDEMPEQKPWQHPNFEAPSANRVPTGPNKLFKRIFIGSIIFFVVCSALALIIIFGGFNIISTNKVDITFFGPVSIAAGEELSLDIDIKNNNSTALDKAVMYVDYPDGTKDQGNKNQLAHEKIEIGSINVGQASRKSVKAVLFGNQHDQKDIKVTVEYSIKGSNEVFKKEKTYSVSLSSTPLVMTITHPQQLISGQDITFDVDIVSNAAIDLHNLLVRAQFPFGFEYKSSTPAPAIGSNPLWSITDLPAGEKKTIRITGTLMGEENDERVFRFTIGEQNPTDPTLISTAYLSQSQTVAVKRPSLQVEMTLNESASTTVVADKSRALIGNIKITNNLTITISNIQVSTAFSGNALDANSPSANGGLYRSLDKTAVWNKIGTPALASLPPGQSTTLLYNFAPLANAPAGSTIMLKTQATGDVADDDGGLQAVVTNQSRTVKLQSSIGLVGRTLYSIGGFPNSGPVPPQVNKKTTYTINWVIQNSSAVYGTIVKANLPQGVEWLGSSLPVTEKVVWNPDTNEVVWNVGDVADPTKGVRQVSFQVSIIPTNSDIDNEPVLVQSPSITATDVFTRAQVSATIESQTTKLTADPKFSGPTGIVIK